MGVEHFVPVSADAEAANDYANCFYACRLCNGARSDVPASAPGKRLLNPCDSVWAERFVVVGDRLRARRGDRDAEHTEKTYDLNDPRKTRARKLRREFVSECWELIEEGSRRVETLIALSEKYDDAEILAAAQDLQRCIRLAAKELETCAAVPFDAPERCRCDLRAELALPEWLEQQIFEM